MDGDESDESDDNWQLAMPQSCQLFIKIQLNQSVKIIGYAAMLPINLTKINYLP